MTRGYPFDLRFESTDETFRGTLIDVARALQLSFVIGPTTIIVTVPDAMTTFQLGVRHGAALRRMDARRGRASLKRPDIVS